MTSPEDSAPLHDHPPADDRAADDRAADDPAAESARLDPHAEWADADALLEGQPTELGE